MSHQAMMAAWAALSTATMGGIGMGLLGLAVQDRSRTCAAWGGLLFALAIIGVAVAR